MATDYGEPVCQSLAGTPLDEQVSALVLRALEPAALEVSLQVAEDLEAERAQRHQHWAQRLERAQYESERAFRQFNAVEPEHRLVARTLERQWEAALAELERLQAEHARFLAAQPAVLRAEERAAIRRLASDIPVLWHAPTTTCADRQAIIRQLVERVVVSVQGETERVEVQVHWIGSHGTQITLTRPVARLEQLSYYPQLLDRVVALHAQGRTQAAIAQALNAEGWHPAKRCETFNAAMVATLLARRGLCSMRPSLAAQLTRHADEWTFPELAQALQMPPPTLYQWLRRGQVQGRRALGGSHPVWLLWADAAELARLRALRAQPRTWHRLASPNHL